MKVKKKHLTGAIANFPKHVVQKMVDEQVKQGNKADPSVFAHIPSASKVENGFDWDNTDAGRDFWADVIRLKCFHLIPKPEKPQGCVHAKAMQQYAKDAKVSKTPWEKWECRNSDVSEDWYSLDNHPIWSALVEYRRKGDNQVKSKEPPTPNEIVRVMLDKDMTVWVGGSDVSYEDARERSCRCIQRVTGYDDSMDYPVRTATTGWTYAVPINPKTMTEITELPK